MDYSLAYFLEIIIILITITGFLMFRATSNLEVQDIQRIIETYVDPEILKDLHSLEIKLLISSAGSTLETYTLSEWKELNQRKDPSYSIGYMSEDNKELYQADTIEYWKINAAILGAARFSNDAYYIKPDLSWKVAIEWARLCTKADESGYLNLGYLDVIKESSGQSYLPGFVAGLTKFCEAEEGILQAVLGKRPNDNSVLGLFN